MAWLQGPRRGVRQITGMALAALLACCALAAPAGAATPYRGVQLHSLWGDTTPADMERELDAARLAGSTAVRVDVGWSSLEQDGKGQIAGFYLERLDRFMAGASARGLAVVADVSSTPCWASTAPDGLKQGCQGAWWDRGVTDYAPADPQDFADIVRWLTTRYSGRLAAVEIWNEPNHPTGMFWKAPDRAAEYARLLRAAYPAAKAGDPAVPVLAGALAKADLPFLEALYANGIQGYYDGLSVHPYDDRGFAALRALRTRQLAHGDTRPVWVTEFGWPTGGDPQWHVTPTAQAANIGTAVLDLGRLPWVRSAFVYNLRDKGTDAGWMEDNFGLLRRDFSTKPAFLALRTALRPPPFHVTVSHRGRSVYVTGTAAPGQLVGVLLSGCPRARAHRVATRALYTGRFTRWVGRTATARGCRITATAPGAGVRASSARVF